MRAHRLAHVQHVYHHEVKSPAEPPTPQISAKVDGKGQLEVSVWNCATPEQAAQLMHDTYQAVKEELESLGVKATAARPKESKDTSAAQ